jgi:hypothetical protein
MVSTSPFSPSHTVRKRDDLTVRPVPELGVCMVYRPGPARMVSLNLSGWLLFEMCDGSTIAEVATRYTEALRRRGRAARRRDCERGLRSLVESALITVSPLHVNDQGGSHD